MSSMPKIALLVKWNGEPETHKLLNDHGTTALDCSLDIRCRVTSNFSPGLAGPHHIYQLLKWLLEKKIDLSQVVKRKEWSKNGEEEVGT